MAEGVGIYCSQSHSRLSSLPVCHNGVTIQTTFICVRSMAVVSPTALFFPPFSIACTVDCHKAWWHRCMYSTAVEVSKILLAGFVSCRVRRMATNLAPLQVSSLTFSANRPLDVSFKKKDVS